MDCRVLVPIGPTHREHHRGAVVERGCLATTKEIPSYVVQGIPTGRGHAGLSEAEKPKNESAARYEPEEIVAGLRCLPVRYYLQNPPELRVGAFRGYHASLVLLRGDIQGDVACGFVWWHSRAGNGRHIFLVSADVTCCTRVLAVETLARGATPKPLRRPNVGFGHRHMTQGAVETVVQVGLNFRNRAALMGQESAEDCH